MMRRGVGELYRNHSSRYTLALSGPDMHTPLITAMLEVLSTNRIFAPSSPLFLLPMSQESPEATGEITFRR